MTTAEFEEEIQDCSTPILVDVFAVWCGPCQMMAPEMEKVAQKLEGRCRVLKVDSDVESDIASTLQACRSFLLQAHTFAPNHSAPCAPSSSAAFLNCATWCMIQIRGLPTILLINDMSIIMRAEGALMADELEQLVSPRSFCSRVG